MYCYANVDLANTLIKKNMYFNRYKEVIVKENSNYNYNLEMEK